MTLNTLTTAVITLRAANRMSNTDTTRSELKRMVAASTIGNKSYMLGSLIPMFTSSIDDGDFSSIHASVAGGGTSLSELKSRIKACGEFIERHCGGYDIDNQRACVIFDSYDRLSDNGELCLCLNDLIPYEDCLYDDPTFPYKRYSSSFPITWVKGVELTHGKDTWLPAQKVFYRFPYSIEEPSYYGGVSTGHACGTSYSHAALGGLYEVVERDSFMLTWLLQIPGKAIKVDAINNDDLRVLYNHISKYLVGGDRLFIYDISKTNGIYTVLTYIRNDLPSAYGLIVSSASHLNPEVALLKSLEELCQMQQFAYNYLLGDETRDCQRMEMDDVDTLVKHCYYYCTGRHSKNIDFISESGVYVYLSEMTDFSKDTDEENFEHLIQLFRNDGQQIYIADATRTELSKSGFFVLKAIIPGYIDLSTSYKYRDQKSSRLQKYQEEYGTEINSNPHPFS